MRKLKTNLYLALWALLGILYFPLFFAFWLLHVIARLLLALAYLGMLKGQIAKRVFESIFETNYRI